MPETVVASLPLVPKSNQSVRLEPDVTIPRVDFNHNLKFEVIPPGPGIFSLNISADTVNVNVVLSVFPILITADCVPVPVNGPVKLTSKTIAP